PVGVVGARVQKPGGADEIDGDAAGEGDAAVDGLTRGDLLAAAGVREGVGDGGVEAGARAEGALEFLLEAAEVAFGGADRVAPSAAIAGGADEVAEGRGAGECAEGGDGVGGAERGEETAGEGLVYVEGAGDLDGAEAAEGRGVDQSAEGRGELVGNADDGRGFGERGRLGVGCGAGHELGSGSEGRGDTGRCRRGVISLHSLRESKRGGRGRHRWGWARRG